MSDDLQALAERAIELEVCPMDHIKFARSLPRRPDWMWRIAGRLREYEAARRPLLSALEVAERERDKARVALIDEHRKSIYLLQEILKHSTIVMTKADQRVEKAEANLALTTKVIEAAREVWDLLQTGGGRRVGRHGLVKAHRKLGVALRALEGREDQQKQEKAMTTCNVDAMEHPTFNSDGYPTEETLERIKTWPIKDGWGALFEFVREAWKYADQGCWKQNGQEYQISTGGWSGNESLIEALEENFIAWTFCWYSSQRGGHYIFRLPEEQPARTPAREQTDTTISKATGEIGKNVEGIEGKSVLGAPTVEAVSPQAPSGSADLHCVNGEAPRVWTQTEVEAIIRAGQKALDTAKTYEASMPHKLAWATEAIAHFMLVDICAREVKP